jgi:MFS family permease
MKGRDWISRILGRKGGEAGDDDLPPNYRWNLVAMATDHTSFTASLAFFSPSSVLPALFRALSASEPIIGFASTVFSLGVYLPQLLYARLVTGKPRKKPYMLTGASGRVLLPLIALALWSGISRTPELAIVFLLACIGIFAIGDGLCALSWLDIMARAIPVSRRGRFVAVSQVAGSLAGVGVGVVLGFIFNSSRLTFPSNYALIFTLAAIAMAPSVVALLSVREPPPAATQGAEKAHRQESWLRAPLSDPMLVRLIVSRVLLNMGGLATPFYVGHAQDVLHLPTAIIGGFVTAQTIGGIVAAVALGPVAERRGPLLVIQIAGAVGLVSPLLALALHLAGEGWLAATYPIVYAAQGAVQSTWLLGFSNYAIEIAPPEMRPAYLGLSNTVVGFMTLAPTLGGWLLQMTSYPVLFCLASLLVMAGVIVTMSMPHAGKRDPDSRLSAEE